MKEPTKSKMIKSNKEARSMPRKKKLKTWIFPTDRGQITIEAENIEEAIKIFNKKNHD